MFNQYPYLNLNDLNLDYILKAIKEMKYEVTNFVSINAIKYADPIQWNITSQYEKNTIVIDPVTGTAYISVAPVPAGVALTRTEYWTVVFDLGSFVTRAAKNFTTRYEQDTTTTATFNSVAGDWLVWGDTLYIANVNITAGDSYVVDGNIRHITVEEVKNTIMQLINDNYDEIINMIGSLDDLTTTDKTNIVAAINELVSADNSLSDRIDDEVQARLDADDSLQNAINNIYIHDVTFNVPTDYQDANAVCEYLKDKIIGDNVVIKYANGTYVGNQLDVKDCDFSKVSIIGNTDDPTAVVINLTNNETAFYLDNSKISLIDGFMCTSNERDTNNHWNGKPNGVFARFNSYAKVGLSMLFNYCYYAVQAANNSFIEMVAGERLTPTICGAITYDNLFSTRKGKNIIAFGCGDVAYFAFNGGVLHINSAIAMNSRDEDIDLGYGILSEHSSSVLAFNCYCANNSQGFGASDAAALIAHDNCLSWYNGQGFESKINASIEIIGAHTYSNAVGIQARDDAFILARDNYCDRDGTGFSAIDGGIIVCDKDNTVNQITGYGYYYDRHSLITPNNHMLGTTTGQILIRGQLMYGNALPITGNWVEGDTIINTDPSNGVFAWVCIQSGVGGTWREVRLNDPLNIPTDRPATPVRGDTIYDLNINKLTTFDGTNWTDASQRLNTFVPSNVVKGACYFSDTLNIPVWFNGANWIDAQGTVVNP